MYIGDDFGFILRMHSTHYLWLFGIGHIVKDHLDI